MLPMPVEAIIDHPLLLNAPSIVYGAVLRLVHHYWRCECEALPDNVRELESIGRMTEHLWRNHGDLIMRVVGDVTPSLDHYFAVRVARRNNLKDLSGRASALRALGAAKKTSADVKRRMGQADLSIPRKQTKRVDAPPPIITSPSGWGAA
jgi:hypothetical protein